MCADNNNNWTVSQSETANLLLELIIVIRILYPLRNSDHSQNLMDLSLARNTHLGTFSCGSINYV